MRTFNYDLRVIGIASCLLLAAAPSLRADEPKQVDAAKATQESSESLDVQLAKVRLQLAKVELDRALAANERTTIFTPTTILLLRRNVEVAEARVDALKESPNVDPHSAHLRELENKLKFAELRWKIATRIRERAPSVIDDARLEALRLRVEVARLTLARARQPDIMTTPIEHFEWELSQLRDELLDITLHFEEQLTRQ